MTLQLKHLCMSCFTPTTDGEIVGYTADIIALGDTEPMKLFDGETLFNSQQRAVEVAQSVIDKLFDSIAPHFEIVAQIAIQPIALYRHCSDEYAADFWQRERKKR